MSRELKHNSGKLVFSQFHSQIFIFTSAAWIESTRSCGLGFILVNSEKVVLLVGGRSSVAVSIIQAEMEALKVTLCCCLKEGLFPSHIYMNCTSVAKLIQKKDLLVSWRFNDQIKKIRHQLRHCEPVQIESILNQAVDMLSKFALKNPVFSLSHRRLMFPNWLVEEVVVALVS